MIFHGSVEVAWLAPCKDEFFLVILSLFYVSILFEEWFKSCSSGVFFYLEL